MDFPTLTDDTPAPDDRTLEERLRFETFLSGLAARLLETAPMELDGAIRASLADLGDYLGSQRGGIGLFSADGASLRFEHGYAAPGLPVLRHGTDLAPLVPWYASELRAGRSVIVARVPDDVPAEAAVDLRNLVPPGIRSSIALPLKVAGEVLGAFGIEYFVERGPWSPELVSRLELLASIYANALYRRRASDRQRRAAAFNRAVLDSVPSEVVTLDREGRIDGFNRAWSRSVGRSHPGTASPLGTDYVAWVAAGEGHRPRARELVTGLRAVLAGTSAQFQFPFDWPDGMGLRSFALTVTPLPRGGAVLVFVEVTELEQAKAALEARLRDVQELKERLEAENVGLHEQVRHGLGFDDIVGTSAALGRVLSQIGQVAPTDAPVLLQGETGTGKDLVARAIHARSPRSNRPLVTVNCAALPASLVESELFGYEKGAFTGALQRTFGRFETAHGGSLFLDEIGELPLEVQAKLLRVLHSGEFERLGSSKTTRVDVRLIAATNRDLEREVREGRFRADLFYRLSVFPVALPALRDRREDVPLLVWNFIGRRQAALGRLVKRVPERLMRAFSAYSWPGNVRELENVVERALILTSGSTLAADPGFVDGAGHATPPISPSASLADAERAHIRAVLEECGWKLAGRGNAAERLGLKRSTLQFRLKKLGIRRPEA